MELQERKRELEQQSINSSCSSFFLYLVVATSEFLPFSDLVPKLRGEDEAKCEVNCVKN